MEGESVMTEHPFQYGLYLWTAQELMDLWYDIESHPVTMGRELFPDQPEGYVRATKDIGNWAANRATHMTCWKRVYREIYNNIEENLPKYAKDFVRGVVSSSSNCCQSTQFVRTDLFFGMEKPDGYVSDEEFNQFVDDHVTPKFPNGFSIVDANGQWMSSSRGLVKEKSKLIVLLHQGEESSSDEESIESIRRAYKRAFNQDSVLRIDNPVNVSF